MIYEGKALRVETLPSGIGHLIFDLQNSSVNKFDALTLNELNEAVAAAAAAQLKGLIFSSAKSTFIVGADITEFTAKFKLDDAEVLAWLEATNKIFNAIEDLPFPTVSAINTVALGGGFELALATDYRVASAKALVGFPEVKLGICPGFGGTVRLPRLIGADNANQWISTGVHVKADQALTEGAVDAIVADDLLIEASEHLIEQCQHGKLDYQQLRTEKTSALTLSDIELAMAYDTAKAMVMAKAGPNYPAPIAAVSAMADAARLDRAGALQCEHQAFLSLAKTEVAANLVQLFLNDQYLGGLAKRQAASAQPVNCAAVLGAGIMGGGIAYQSALKSTPILMKDIAQAGLDLGVAEAKKHLSKKVAKGRLSTEKMITVLGNIRPTLDYSGFDKVDVVIEAVVENPAVKKAVLTEVEKEISADSFLATNTSTISVDSLAVSLQRPENFCGMHFFNPVALMPLVEVIRGEKSSDECVATVVAYARKMGKTPIVVKDCPGFLVNRILFPYFSGFSRLIHDGADFVQIDKAMEKFGWPMGPAYLLDVVGMDTGVHAQAVMAEGFPERMPVDYRSAMDVMFENKRFGQKTGSGFYRYETDKRGRLKKLVDADVEPLIESVQSQKKDFSDTEIVERMMVCLCLETVRCLEDGIVGSAIEADMGLILGLAFPTFRGGALRYIDSVGVAEFTAIADKYADLGALYHPTELMRKMAADGRTFY